ncbi:MAG: gamma-glutamylcyclotransferase [Candidatus Methylomirabilia bacterium]
MSGGSDFLFVYGTLMRGLPLHHLIAGRADFVEAGTAGGGLLDLDGYPGAVQDHGGLIRGEVYRFSAPGLLAVLDREEGYDPAAEDRSLYLRRQTRVHLTGGGQVTAWIYWYNGRRRRAVPISGGDYRQHLSAQRLHRSRSFFTSGRVLHGAAESSRPRQG